MRTVKKYRVKWLEEHEVEIEASDEDSAIAAAQIEEWDETHQRSFNHAVEFVEGLCEEHKRALDSDECCGSCNAEPEWDKGGAA